MNFSQTCSRSMTPVNAKIDGDNISTKHAAAFALHIVVHKPSIPRERNLFKRRSGPLPEPCHVPRGKAIHAEHHSKGDYGRTQKEVFIDDESMLKILFVCARIEKFWKEGFHIWSCWAVSRACKQIRWETFGSETFVI